MSKLKKKSLIPKSQEAKDEALFENGMTYLPCKNCGSINYTEAYDDPNFSLYEVIWPITCEQCDTFYKRPLIHQQH